VAGPIIGGGLIAANIYGLDWRPIFLVNIPVGIFAAIAGAVLIPKIPAHRELKNDYIGILIFGLAITGVVFPLVEGRAYGWPLWAFAMLGASLLLLVVFYLWERRRERLGLSELLPVKLLANRNFALGVFICMIFFSGVPGFFMILAIFLQSGFGLTPLESGLTTIPFSVGVLIASVISGRLGGRLLTQRVAAGSLLLALGMAYVRYTIGAVGTAVDHWQFLPPLLIAGIGLGIGISGLFQTVLLAVPPRDAGSASGSLQAFQQVGGALGVALVGEIFFTWLANAGDWGSRSRPEAFIHAAQGATIYEISAFLLVALLVLFLRPQPRGQGAAPSLRAPLET
jgi:predicted MFS family arabinose efflux permease